MNVDRSEKIWAYDSTGTWMHAFVQTGSAGNKRAMCRANIERSADAIFVGHPRAYLICARCIKLAFAMWDREEASMQPATEAHDLGYVAPVDESKPAAIPQTVTIQGQPAETLADAQAIVVRELRAAASMDAAHAEALEMDAIETAKVKLTGKTFRPTPVNLAWSKDARATVTDVVLSHTGAVRVIFTVEDEGTWTAGAQLGVFQRSWTADREITPTFRWHYRAHRMTPYGAFLGIVEGYLTAPDAAAVERHVRAEYDHPERPLGNFNIRPVPTPKD